MKKLTLRVMKVEASDNRSPIIWKVCLIGVDQIARFELHIKDKELTSQWSPGSLHTIAFDELSG